MKKKKKLPKLSTDREAEDFVAKSDLTQYDLSGMTTVQFEFAPKAARINMRMPADLLRAVKRTAARRGVPYQRFIRQLLERAISQPENANPRRRKAG
jgi:predicted DNA binding CopG/RHH family protein